MFHPAVRVSFIALLAGLLCTAWGTVRAFAEPEIEVFTVYYTRVAPLVEKLSPLLSARGRIAVEEKSNTLVVRDEGANITAIRSALQKLDVRQPRVRIAASFVAKESADEMVQWYLQTKDWSQGFIKGGAELFVGLESTPMGAGRKLVGYNRQILLLDAGENGSITVSERLFDARGLMWLGMKNGYISPQARFQDIGSALGIVCKITQEGKVEAVVTPKVVRIDGGSDIYYEREHTLMVLESGKPVVVGGATEDEEGVGNLLFRLQMGDGSVKRSYLVLSATVE